MGIAYVGKTESNETTTTATINVGVGSPTQGNFLLLMAFHVDNNTINTAPAGWTELQLHLADAAAGSTQACSMWYKFAGASEPDTTVVTANASSQPSSEVLEFSGVAGIDAGIQLSTVGFSTTRVCPAVTTIADDAWWIAGVVHDDENDAPPTHDGTGMTDIAREITGTAANGQGGFGLIYKEIATGQSTGTFTWTIGGTETLQAFSFSLAPLEITSVSTDDTIGATENPWTIAGSGFGTQ